MINFLTLSLKCKKLKLILSILFLLSFCFTKSQKETLTINIPKNLKSIRAGYPVYHITANANGNNLYLYNKLNVDNTGIFSYNPISGSTTFLDFDKPIGDCIYNPFQDHFLISKLEPDNAKIVCFDASDNDILDGIVMGENQQFVKEMFISPEGKLYVMSNMLYSLIPNIYIYDATDPNYSKIAGPLSVGSLTCEDDFIYYAAHFCSNPINEDPEVYVSICPQEKKSPPYNTETNRMYDFVPHHENNGKLLRLKDGLIFDFVLNEFSGKVIYPDRSQFGGNSQYDGRVFIIGKYLRQYKTSALGQIYSYGQHDFIDITYNAFNDKLFAFTNTPHDTCGEDRSCVIWTIDINPSGTPIISEYNIAPIPGQAASFFSNPYNGKVYLHQKVDNIKLGDTQVSLHSFDPSDEDPGWQTTPLGITSFSPEYDQTCDPSKAQFYNITTPYINPYTNHIYLPNGGHSCISKISFSPKEHLLLNNGDWAWLSFPRLNRYGNDPFPVNDVLSGNIDPNTPPNNYLPGSELQNLPPAQSGEVENIFDGTEWLPTGGLYDIQSTLGYKLKLDYTTQPEEKWLHLIGNVLDPDTSVKIYDNYDNWVAYWLHETQSPFDAIPDNVLDELTSIKAQFWSCVKEWHSPEGYPQPYWMCACHQSGISLNYGDMVILRTNSELSFQWQRFGNPPASEEKSATEYYQYNEQADYTSFFVELDTIANPLEIGAFVGDSCIGASTVLTNDTIVLIPGYIEGMSGDVTFEEYYDSLKSNKPAIKEYLVNNNKTGTWEKRIINTVEKQDYYFVSFKNHKHDNKNLFTNEPIWISCLPNPFKDYCTIEYFITVECNVQIVVYDLYGKSLNILQQGVSEAGNYSINWTGTDSNGNPLPNGVYILKLRAGTNYAQTKIIIMK